MVNIEPGEAAPSAGAPGAIPYRMMVGVTGHRRLPVDSALTEQVRRALDRMRRLAPTSKHTPVCFGVVSPLAEGADRLVARELLRDPEATLEVPLPLPREEYLADFATSTSREEFDDLLRRASLAVVMPPAETRRSAYAEVGRYVVDRCDVLFALWDGEPTRGRGGTAEIVAYARERRVPILWIRTAPPYELSEELGGGIAMGAFEPMDRYNAAPIDRFDDACGREAARLARDAEQAGLDHGAVGPFLAWICPYAVRASAIASGQQRRYFALGNALFLATAAAVAVTAALALFATEGSQSAWVEVAVAVTLLSLVAADRAWKPQERWISARFLADRCRAAPFVALAGVGASRVVGPEQIYLSHALSHTSEAWVTRAFDEVWGRRPTLVLGEAYTEALRRFLTRSWIVDQRDYHDRASRRHRDRHRRLARAGVILFGLTLVAALLKALGVGEVGAAGRFDAGKWLDLLGVALPALAGALTGIRAQREYVRNAERYHRMVPYLEVLARRMVAARDLAAVRAVAAEAEAVMLNESRDWFVVMRATGVGPG